jgi:hypothetical protein
MLANHIERLQAYVVRGSELYSFDSIRNYSAVSRCAITETAEYFSDRVRFGTTQIRVLTMQSHERIATGIRFLIGVEILYVTETAAALRHPDDPSAHSLLYIMSIHTDGHTRVRLCGLARF